MGSKDLDPAQRTETFYPEYDQRSEELIGIPFDPWKAVASEAWEIRSQGLIALGGEMLEDGSVLMPGGNARHFPDGRSTYHDQIGVNSHVDTKKGDENIRQITYHNYRELDVTWIHTSHTIIEPKPPKEGQPFDQIIESKPPKDY